MSELENLFPPSALSMLVREYDIPVEMRIALLPVTLRILLTAITPPAWCWRNVIAQMSLALVLDIKRETRVRQTFPLRR
jgi:hypothetical protein